MSNNRVFNQLIEQLLVQYSATPPSSIKEDQNIYQFKLENNTKMNVLSDEKGYLCMVGFIPLPEQTLNRNCLSDILQFNHFTLHNPFFVIGFEPEEQELSLHVRQSMIELDNSAAYQLFENMIDKVTRLQHWLTSLPA